MQIIYRNLSTATPEKLCEERYKGGGGMGPENKGKAIDTFTPSAASHVSRSPKSTIDLALRPNPQGPRDPSDLDPCGSRGTCRRREFGFDGDTLRLAS